MPYLSRRHQLGSSLLYHVFNRVNGHVILFPDKEDYRFFLSLLGRYAKKYKFRIYHWVLMPTHYHLLLEIEEPEKLSSVMAGLARAYAYYYHDRYRSFGHLWQGRFKSQAIQKEIYILSCGRYIEQGPVEAKIVKDAGEYPYSSASYYVFGKNGLTAEDPVFKTLGRSLKKRRKKYEKFLAVSDLKEKERFEHLEFPQGSKEFLKRLVYENGHFFPRRKGRARK